MPTALVTGASGGIGREIAVALAQRGYDLVVSARSGDRLAALADEIHARLPVAVRSVTADLTDVGEAARVVEAAGDVDVLVANAGVADYGPFVEQDPDAQLDLLRLNVLSLTSMVRLTLPAMLARGSGRVLTLASTAAFAPGPLMAVYYASKAYVLSLSEALAEELRGTGVTVTALCPGPTASGFQERAGMTASRLVAGRDLAPAHTVAEAGVRGMLAGRPVVFPGLRDRVVAQGLRMGPRTLTRRAVHRAQQRVDD